MSEKSAKKYFDLLLKYQHKLRYGHGQMLHFYKLHHRIQTSTSLHLNIVNNKLLKSRLFELKQKIFSFHTY